MSMAELHPDQEEFRAQVFEVLCKLVEFTEAFLSDYVGDPANQELKLPILKNVVEAISITLDSNMRYYSSGNREILVLPSRLECALLVPGYFVKIFGASDNKTHYFCSQKGVNQVGVTSECCTLPSEVDGVLMNVYWQLANTAGVNGYEFLLKILITDTQPSLPLIAFILRPFAEVFKCSWGILLQHLEGNFSDGDMMRICHSAYSKVFQYLIKILLDRNDCHTSKFRSPLQFNNIFCSRSLFVNILILLHTIWSWSLSYFPTYRIADGAVLLFDDPGHLLILFLERTIELGKAHLVCKIVGEIRQAIFAQASGLGKRSFVGPSINWAPRFILERFNMDAYTTKSKTYVCKWLKRWQAKDSVISSHTVRCILEKLIVCDKDKKLRIRLLNLLWKHASDLPASEFVGCLRKIACHYTSIATPRIMIHPGEETEEFLQACSSADTVSTVSRHMGIKFEDKAFIEQRAKMYQDMEDLISGLKTTTQYEPNWEPSVGASLNNMASVMTSAVAPELRTLEAIKKDIALRPELRQRMQDAEERHLREYDALKRDQYKCLEKFFQDCLQEKERIVRDALYAKAKVVAAIEMANVQSTELSSDDIFRRMLQKAGDTIEETGEKHRKSMEKMPNLDCNVCFVHFTAKRKRACFDPSGYMGTCIDCGIREWKRTKTCPLCQSGTVKPTVVPSMLFF